MWKHRYYKGCHSIAVCRILNFFAKLLKIRKPWFVSDVVVDEERDVVSFIADVFAEKLPCPKCGKRCSRYDTRMSRWRHLDTMEYGTMIQCEVPRIRCSEHGVLKVRVPWAEPLSRYTVAFENYIIEKHFRSAIPCTQKGLYFPILCTVN
ncbi:MAG: transposase family protein [Candidatus Kapaibacterium sp.]